MSGERERRVQVVDQLNLEWARILDARAAAPALDAWRAGEPDLAGFADLEAIQDASRTRRNPAARDALLLALLRRAQAGDAHAALAARTVLQLMLGAVMTTAHRMRGHFA